MPSGSAPIIARYTLSGDRACESGSSAASSCPVKPAATVAFPVSNADSGSPTTSTRAAVP
jgi:hypothetical protein